VFLLGLASEFNPYTCVSPEAGITGMSHHPQLVEMGSRILFAQAILKT
jgi:hypothetical protein